MINYLNKQFPLTISMWDFSWLLASHPAGHFEDLEKRVEEAAIRGYNTLRIDCFPSHLVKEKAVFSKNWNLGSDLPRWGQVGRDFECNPLDHLTLLAELCRKHGIWLGLDSWDTTHMVGHNQIIESQEEEQTCRHIAQNWVKAIRLMREAGILERAVWIAPMNEVPYFITRKLRSSILLNDRIRYEGETTIDSTIEMEEIHKRFNHWIGEAIKEEIRTDGIPLSYSSLGAEKYANRLTDIYDVVDVHFMPSVIMEEWDQNAFEHKAGKGASGFSNFSQLNGYNLQEYSNVWNETCRKHYGRMLTRVREYHETALAHLTLESGKHLCPIITESFGPCYFPDAPDVDWKWYKNYNADAAKLVAHLPFAGTTLSNYAEPIFSLWEDEDWHRNTNIFIRSLDSCN